MTTASGQPDPPPLPLPGGEGPSRLEVLLSLVVPGAGQVVQRRWVSAGWQLLAVAALVAVILHETFGPLYDLLCILVRPEGLAAHDELPAPSIKVILVAFGLFMILQVVSLVDAAIGYRRRVLRWKREQRGSVGKGSG